MTNPSSAIPAWYPVTPEEERAWAVAAVGEDLAAAFAAIELVVLDADGVLTAGDLIYGPQGEALKTFNALDGLGLVLARAAGIKRAVLTGRLSDMVALRCGELHFEALKLGRFDKAAALAEILNETGCAAGRTLYMGDDVIDMAAMAGVALAVTVPAAPRVVCDACRYVTSAGGGRGAVREVMDLVLKSRGVFGMVLGDVTARHPHVPAADQPAGETG